MKKRILAVLLATVLLLSNFCVIYAEEQSFKEDIYTYILNGGNAVITAVDDVGGEVIVPEKLGGYNVAEIADGAFGGNANTTYVYLPDSIKKIGAMCFAYCGNIKGVRLPSNITTIDDGTFYQCRALIGVTIPDGVQSIGSKAFAQCDNIVSVAIPNFVTTISEDAFVDDPVIRFHCRLSEECPAYYWGLARGIDCEELIKVYVNGTRIDFDQSPITEPKRFRTLVPIRSVLECMGAEIEWFDDMEYAGIDIDGHRMLIKPDSEFMMLNGKRYDLTCPAMEYNGRILLPIRDVVQAIGGKVSWDEDTKVVNITYNK